MTERELFAQALEIHAPGERAGFLEQACVGDEALRTRLERLLAEEQLLGSFLEAPCGQFAVVEQAACARPGLFVGRYELRELIGEGGMGTVWLAEQTEPVKRRVAVKLIKPGLDTRQVLARFETERQALALMDHPNIAKFIDAGMVGEVARRQEIGNRRQETGNRRQETGNRQQAEELSPVPCPLSPSAGRPYFVMEHVAGVPITDYCQSTKLPIRDKLRLFLQVCQAVQHAHQKGVIHRDLKPSNILVCQYDGVPVPKVIDFGLAKAISAAGGLTEHTLYTAHGLMVGTPLYMSPEQAELNNADIDTRTDIYSLGVILYELLTGTTPFDKDRLKRAGFDEMRRIIREEEPDTISARLARTRRGVGVSPAISRSFLNPEPRTLNPSAELDWIAMKALDKDRARRYETAAGLAEDIERFLRDDPVEACPPSRMYLLRKLAYKHRGLLTTAATLTALLVAGIAVSTWAAIVANRAKREALAAAAAEKAARQEAQAAVAAEHKARQEAERVTHLATRRESEKVAVLNFLQRDILQRIEVGNGSGQELTLREAMKSALPSIESNFKSEPLLEASLRFSLGRAFVSLNEWVIASAQYEAAYALYRKHLGPEAPETLQIASFLAYSYDQLGRPAEALAVYQSTFETTSRIQGASHIDTLWNMQHIANHYVDLGRHEEAIALHEQAHEIRKSHFPSDDEGLLTSLEWLAIAYIRGGRTNEGFRLYEKLANRCRAKFGADPERMFSCLQQITYMYFDLGQVREGLGRCREALAEMKSKLGTTHRLTLRTAHYLADKSFEFGRRADALKMREEILAVRKETLGPDDSDTLLSMLELANSYLNAGRHNEAVTLDEHVLDRRRQLLGADHLDTLTSINNLANDYAALGREEEALSLREAALALRSAKLGPGHHRVLMSKRNLARSYTALGRHDEAIALAEKTLAEYKNLVSADHRWTFPARRVLAAAYATAGRHQEALCVWQEALPLHRTKFSASHQDTLAVLKGMAESLLALNRADEAVPLLDECLELSQGQLLDPAFVAAAETLRERARAEVASETQQD